VVARPCGCDRLAGLELCGGRVSDRGLAHLAKLTALQSLNLSQNSRITNAGVAQLSTLQNLTCLNVSHCQVRLIMITIGSA
jgi:Leucine-rich repeat (LRR) protein